MRALALAVASFFFAWGGGASGQAFPTKPVRIVIAHAPGGPPDILMRSMAPFLAKTFGQPFVIENREGANGIVGAESVAKSAPDGHTLLMTSAFTVTLNTFMYDKLPYDPERDFAPVVHVGGLNSAVMVHPSVPARNWQELVALARAKPDTISWASVGSSSSAALFREWMAKSMGITFYNVPYKNYLQALSAVTAGDVNVAIFGVGGVIPLAKAGKVRPLAVIDSNRSQYMPDLPSFKELGFDVFFRSWFALYAPKATPVDVVRRLNSEVARTLKEPVIIEKALTPQGFELHDPAGGPPEALVAYIREERDMYARVTKILGIKPQ